MRPGSLLEGSLERNSLQGGNLTIGSIHGVNLEGGSLCGGNPEGGNLKKGRFHGAVSKEASAGHDLYRGNIEAFGSAVMQRVELISVSQADRIEAADPAVDGHRCVHHPAQHLT